MNKLNGDGAMKEKLARITKAGLEIKERGILNFWIFVDYEDGFSQRIGGIALDTWSDEKKDRIGTAYGCEMIRRILLCMNVDNFNEMEGRDIFVLGDGEGFIFDPKGIKTLRADGGKSVVFSEVAKEFGL